MTPEQPSTPMPAPQITLEQLYQQLGEAVAALRVWQQRALALEQALKAAQSQAVPDTEVP